MNSYRTNAIVAGVLLLIGFMGVFIVAITNPILEDTNYLDLIAENANPVLLGALLQLIMAFACAGIPIGLYPVLKKHYQALALGAVGFRIIEAVLFTIGAIGLLSLVTLSQRYSEAGLTDTSYIQPLGELILAAREWAGEVAGLLAWSLGALMYQSIFYKKKLIPRWLSIWGLAGVPPVIISCMLVLFQVIHPRSTSQVLLNLPLGLQEIPLAVWLIAKGFNPSVIDSGVNSQN